MKKPIVFALIGLLFQSFLSNGQTSEIFATSEGAIQGYDVVAYFNESKPVKGKKEFLTNYAGETWHFASAENLKSFQTSPEKYMPQFGGYCAYGMSRGYKAKTDPEAWTIVDGKLYLNYNLEVRKIWNEKQDEFINKANTNWPTVKRSVFK
jgi:YHS domain-containing protein